MAAITDSREEANRLAKEAAIAAAGTLAVDMRDTAIDAVDSAIDAVDEVRRRSNLRMLLVLLVTVGVIAGIAAYLKSRDVDTADTTPSPPA